MKKIYYLILLFIMIIKMITLSVKKIQSYETSIASQDIVDTQKGTEEAEEDEEMEEEYSYNERHLYKKIRQELNESYIQYNEVA